MKNLTFLIKPASSFCNMRCKYCFYDDVSNSRKVKNLGFMTKETVDKMLSNIYSSVSDGDQITFAFQGGEPTIAGLEFFEYFADKANNAEKNIKLFFTMQTNGLMIDEEWCGFLKKYDFLVGVSLDIPRSEHDRVRLDIDGKGTYTRIEKAIKLFNKFRIRYNILCTLTNAVARYPMKLWNEICKMNIEYTQLTPCIGELDSDSSPYALTPRMFASFYKELFNLWYADYRKGKIRSIKLFDDIINLIVLGIPTACGIDGKCRPQLVVEADGSVYPCDFYCSDRYLMGNICTDGVDELWSSDGLGDFLNRQSPKLQMCTACRYAKFCGGYCERMRSEVCGLLDGNYCGYKDFLDYAGKDFTDISMELRKERFR